MQLSSSRALQVLGAHLADVAEQVVGRRAALGVATARDLDDVHPGELVHVLGEVAAHHRARVRGHRHRLVGQVLRVLDRLDEVLGWDLQQRGEAANHAGLLRGGLLGDDYLGVALHRDQRGAVAVHDGAARCGHQRVAQLVGVHHRGGRSVVDDLQGPEPQHHEGEQAYPHHREEPEPQRRPARDIRG